MCKYCNSEEYAPLIPASNSEQLQIEAGINIRLTNDFQEDYASLDVDLLYEWDELNSKSIRINYCPVCGRKIGRTEQ